ncbi:MAG: ABC transporter ATP-binding protein [Candidatus Fonsibacter ubiquis]|nr:ABC transporter ATP-binding protein [Candidatus Fonsibacter ubiquis]
MSNLLKVENLSRSFGGIHANSDITFDVNEGEILGVIGPNGAGKSTLFDLITGFTKSDKGQVILRDKNITNIRPDLICRLGVGRTFQKLKPFADQTLLENVIVGALVKEKNLKVARDKALEIIDFVDLIEKRHHYAKELSTGQRKRLELARALATDPKLLLMDEVTGGVDQRTIPGLVELVLKLKKNGITVVTIEHNMKIIMDISDRILALNQGKRIAFDTPKNISQNTQHCLALMDQEKVLSSIVLVV